MSKIAKIMIVDDEPDLLRMVELYLRAWEFDVVAFKDPLVALAYFAESPDSIRLLLTDIRMPNISGIELAQRILRIAPDTKIVLMTAFDVQTHELETQLPIVTYSEVLRKPFRLAEVCNAVKRQLQIVK